MFKVGQLYSVNEMSSGEFNMAYDGFYAVVDGKLEALSMWEDEVAQGYMDKDKLSKDEAYKEARENILFHLRPVYENAKDIAVFVGVPPAKGSDLYSTFKCVDVL